MVERLQRYVYTTQGRLNRLRYLKYSVLFGLFMTLATSLVTYLAILLTGDENSLLVEVVSFALTLAGILGYIALMIRRLHDLNRPDYWVVGAIIPIVNVILSFYLLLIRGTYGRNVYGEDPLR